MAGKSLDNFIQPKKDRLRWENPATLYNLGFTIMLNTFNSST